MDNYTTFGDTPVSLDEGTDDGPDSSTVDGLLSAPPAAPVVRKRATRKAPAQDVSVGNAPAKKAPANEAAVKIAPAEKAAAKKAPGKKATVKKVTATKTVAKKAPAKKAPAKKAPAKKAVAKAVKNAPAKKATAKKATATKLATVMLAESTPAIVADSGVTSTADASSDVALTTPSTETAAIDGTKNPEQPTRPRSRIAAAVALLMAAALVFAVIAGVLWWRADHDATRRKGLIRDEALLAARIGVDRVSTSDYRHPTATLDAWLSVSTGTLHSQFSQSRASATKLLSEAKVITTATVLDAAVLTLNTTKGAATVIASVNLRKQPATGAAATSRNRLKASLTRVQGRWKLSDLQVVSVSVS